jgi:divalent metal cation (Fe/Co/Zn/Cd) transporter
MSQQNASIKSILFALLANMGIAITKTAAAILTGSGAMLAESIHSINLSITQTHASLN